VYASLFSQKKIIHVKRSSTRENQTIVAWHSLYKALIAWMYEQHEEILHRFNLPTYVYRLQQGKMITWLEEHIFAPRASLPIIGTLEFPDAFDWDNYELGSIQSELINYFAQDEDNNLLVRGTSLSLVKQFYLEHRGEFHSVSDKLDYFQLSGLIECVHSDHV
jgi:hypothetical protein